MKKLLMGILLLISGSTVFAQTTVMPRFGYIQDDELIGNYHFAGLAYGESQTIEDFKGISLRYGKGHYGKKTTLSYMSGTSKAGYEIGVSSVTQNPDTVVSLTKQKTVALEASIRIIAVMVILNATENESYVTVGYGF